MLYLPTPLALVGGGNLTGVEAVLLNPNHCTPGQEKK